MCSIQSGVIGMSAHERMRGITSLPHRRIGPMRSPFAQARSVLHTCENVEFHVNNGADLSMFANDQFDFAISAIVFQHIPKKAIVENYIRETWRVLRPGSIFKFQVQGCLIDEKR